MTIGVIGTVTLKELPHGGGWAMTYESVGAAIPPGGLAEAVRWIGWAAKRFGVTLKIDVLALSDEGQREMQEQERACTCDVCESDRGSGASGPGAH